MSEFECARGHLLSSEEAMHGCKICGGRAVRMDGMSARALRQQEQDDIDRSNEEEDDRDSPNVNRDY